MRPEVNVEILTYFRDQMNTRHAMFV